MLGAARFAATVREAALWSCGPPGITQDYLVAAGEQDGFMPATLRDLLLRCLGGPWPEPCDLAPRTRDVMRKDGYRVESLTFQAEPGDHVPALLLVPDGVSAACPAPAVLVLHQHNGQWHLGKSEPAGLAGDAAQHVGVRLVREGFVVLCPDALCFEERQDATLRDGDFERFEFLRYVVAGRCMAWKNILDIRRAVDYLCSRAEVRGERVGCFGHSMGATHVWLAGPWEPRLRCLVANCCLPTYKSIHRCRLLHCFPNFVPGFHAYGDTPDMAALIAPRRLHMNFGELDPLSPIEEVRDGLAAIGRAYSAAGAGASFTSYIEPGAGHCLSDEMWRRTMAAFEGELR